MSLISLIKKTRWIDLSPKHKELRVYLEQALASSNQDKIPMLKGAFGIGKTNTLHYVFHYGWCKLKTPVFYVSLEKLYPILEKIANEKPDKKIGNVELCEIVDDKVKSALDALKNNDANEDSALFFFDWKEGTLESFCADFTPLSFQYLNNDAFEKEEFELLSPQLIQAAIESGRRPLLLLDEFETKFTKLKALIDASSGGEIRELFDQVVEGKVSFNLIIGTGPASGYELKSDNSDAESSRIIPKQIPFPLPENTIQFLETTNRGLLNFAWWASRCRARHFLRLKEAVGNLDLLTSKNSYAEFLSDFTFFSDPIESSEEGASPITYVKTQAFNDFPEGLKDFYLPKLITEIKPQRISFNDHSESILKAKKYLFCAPSLLNVTSKLMVALSSDINESILKKLKEEGQFLELDYDLTLRKYFDFFLKSIADNEGNIVFGMVDDSAAEKTFTELFLLPLMLLTFDFITQYEEESLVRNKQATEFITRLLDEIKKKSDSREIRTLLPQTYSLFKKNDYLNGEGYIQLSLKSIRETFEQPIGEPKLGYKNQNLDVLIGNLNIDRDSPFIVFTDDKTQLYFIPDLPQKELESYFIRLGKFFDKNIIMPIHDDGKLVVNFIYLGSKSETFEKFKTKILNNSANSDIPFPASILKKLDCRSINEYKLNFPKHTLDFLDSLAKITIINSDRKDLTINTNEGVVEVRKIIEALKDPTWTERKETKRTIEHFEKVVLTNTNSELKLLSSQALLFYENKLLTLIPEKQSFSRSLTKNLLNDGLFEGDTGYGTFTKKIISMFLLENRDLPEGLLDVLKESYDFKFGAKQTEKDQKLSFYEFKTFIQTKGDIIRKHFDSFSKDLSVVQNLTSLVQLLKKDNAPTSLAEYLNYLNYSEEHFFQSYHKRLGNFTDTLLTETIYNSEFGTSVNLDDEKTTLIAKILSTKEAINSLKTDISEMNSRLKELLKLEELPFGYESKLGELNSKLLNRLQKQLESCTTLSHLIIIYEVVSYFDNVLKDAKTFFSDLKTLESSINSKYLKINQIQESVNKIYKDVFYFNILNNALGVKNQSGDYFWSAVMLNTIRAIPKYTNIFKRREEYLPTEKRVIDKNDVQTFLTEINLKFNEKLPKIQADKQSLDVHVQDINKFINLENQLKELLTID